MAKATLPTNYRDDILNVSTEGKRKYRMNYNDDGTVSFIDVTPYDQEGSDFGAGDINATNQAVNESFDKNKLIRDMDAINALTEEGYAPDALALKDVNDSLQALPLKDIEVIIMNMPSSLDADTRQDLPSGFTYDNAVILSSMVNYSGNWQLSEPQSGFATGIVDTNKIFIYSRRDIFLNRPVKIVIGRY